MAGMDQKDSLFLEGVAALVVVTAVAGTMLPRFFLFFVGRPVMPGIMAGLDQLVQTVRAAVAVYFQGRRHLVVDVLVVLRDPTVAARSETH